MDIVMTLAWVLAPTLAVVALATTAHANRTGRYLALDPRRLALGQGALIAGIVFWLKVADTEGIGTPWAAGVAVVLGLVAVAAARDPLRAGRILWVLAVVFPACVLAGISVRYLFADGMTSGAGGTEPMSEMVVVALMASIGFFSGPAYSVGSVLGVGEGRTSQATGRLATH